MILDTFLLIFCMFKREREGEIDKCKLEYEVFLLPTYGVLVLFIALQNDFKQFKNLKYFWQ